MLTGALLALYVDMAQDAGRCTVWMLPDELAVIEQTMSAAEPPVWRSYLRGKAMTSKPGLSMGQCTRLFQLHTETLHMIKRVRENAISNSAR